MAAVLVYQSSGRRRRMAALNTGVDLELEQAAIAAVKLEKIVEPFSPKHQMEIKPRT